MALHLIKLAVGCESVKDLTERVAERGKRTGQHIHITRMVPKRADELLDGGSLYWVMKGSVRCRHY